MILRSIIDFSKRTIRTSSCITAAALGGVAYTVAWTAALAAVLAAWGQFHSVLRYLGNDTIVFFGTVAVVGSVVFAIVAEFLKYLISPWHGLPQHFRRAWALYGLAIWMLVMNIASWPSAGARFEGGNLMVLVALSLAVLGIGIDWAMNRRSRSTDHEQRDGSNGA